MIGSVKYSQLVRSIRFYPAKDGPCKRIWAVFYSQDCQARFLKVTTLQRVQLLKDCTRFHRFTKGSQIIKTATRTQHGFGSPRRPSALLNSYVIAHSLKGVASFTFWDKFFQFAVHVRPIHNSVRPSQTTLNSDMGFRSQTLRDDKLWTLENNTILSG